MSPARLQALSDNNPPAVVIAARDLFVAVHEFEHGPVHRILQRDPMSALGVKPP